MSVGTVELAPGYAISRLIRGGWQLGRKGAADPIDELADFARAGITTFEVSDTYDGAEGLLGRFVAQAPSRLGSDIARGIKVHTRYTAPLGPDAPTRDSVTASIDRSLQRLGLERLDLLQIQWWDFATPGLHDVAGWLIDLVATGKIGGLGVTNFGVEPLKALLDAGAPIVSDQVQCSLLDRRALGRLTEFCRAKGIAVLTFGALAGGFLSDRWLGISSGAEGVAPEEYRCIVEEAGGWDTLQKLLATLDEVARAREVDIATVALAWILARREISATLVGASSTARIPGLVRACELVLSEDEEGKIGKALRQARAIAGDPGDLERDTGRPLARLIRSRLGG